MAPAYKLTYFNVRGLGEPIRYLFAYGGIEYEDIRFEEDEWPQLKDKTPFGCVPVLEHNGKTTPQSVAIARYVAKKVKLTGNDDWENLEIDAIVDTIVDFRTKSCVFYTEEDEEKKKALITVAQNETLPFYASRFEAIVQKNNGYLALGRLTWADLFFTATFEFVRDAIGGDNFDKYPDLKALIDKVNSIAAIKKWIETRPTTSV